MTITTTSVLESFADDFTKALNWPCRLYHAGSGAYCIAKRLDGGAVHPITRFCSKAELYYICQAFLQGHATAVRQSETKQELTK